MSIHHVDSCDDCTVAMAELEAIVMRRLAPIEEQLARYREIEGELNAQIEIIHAMVVEMRSVL